MAARKKVEPIVIKNAETNEDLILDFNRAIVVKMEREGYAINKFMELLDEAPFSSIATMFYYATLMHQPETSYAEAEEILFDGIGISGDLVNGLAELFIQCVTSMQADGSKNGKWAMVKRK